MPFTVTGITAILSKVFVQTLKCLSFLTGDASLHPPAAAACLGNFMPPDSSSVTEKRAPLG